MKLKNVNKEKIKKIKKIKLFILIPVLLGTLSMTACTNQSFNNKEDNEVIQEMQDNKTYQLNIVYSNTQNIDGNDVISIFDENAEIYGALSIIPGEEDRVMEIATSKYIISSKLLGKIKVELDEDEEVYLYLDYLHKTMDLEVKKKNIK